jgi:hypothetical protein
MNKHPKLPPKHYTRATSRVIKVAVPMLGDKGPMVNQVRAANVEMKNSGVRAGRYMRGNTGKLGNSRD